LKKLIIFIIFVAFAFGIYYVKNINEDAKAAFHFRDDFETLNREFWYVGEWKTNFSAYDKVKLNKGKLILEVDITDRGPYLLSKPLSLTKGDTLTIKRRVKMEYANEFFTGGLVVYETADEGLIPSVLNNSLSTLGNGVVLIEYVHSYDENAVRPGSNVFRVLPRGWETDDNYELAEPIFSEWFEEELVYNTTTGTITYMLDGEVYEVSSQAMNEESIRLFMHGYGFGTGHIVEIDWIEISIK